MSDHFTAWPPANGAPLPLLFRPSSLGKGQPLLLLLHGVGGNESNLRSLAALIPPAINVALLRAPLSIGPGQFAWFPVAFTASGPVIDAAQAEASRQQLIALATQLASHPDIVANKLCLAGFSQGGIMSASVGLTRPDLVPCFGILSGRILPEIEPLFADKAQLAAAQAFVAHGLDDSRLPLHFGRQSRALLEELGVGLDYLEFPGDHEIVADEAERFIDWLVRQLPAQPKD
jgi:phospholipase/carboxylesterase